MKRLAILAALVALGAAAPAVRLSWNADHLPAVGAKANARDGGLSFQALAMVGREDRIAAADDTTPQRCTTTDGAPVAAIAALAANAQVVIVNEAHDSPRDRAFIADLAAALYPLGYHTYAGETLMAPPGNYQTIGPDINDGYYANEPVFGALLGSAKALGYRFLPYDGVGQNTGDQFRDINTREELQARTLAAWLAGHPDEKLLVHAGYSHNLELTERVEDLGRIQWMAERLADKSKLNPLTIDQTTFTAERAGVCATTEAGAAMPLGRDIYVAHPQLTFQRNRPTWRLAEGQRFTDVPRALRRSDARVIVEARRADDSDDAVPVDRVLIDPDETIPLLLAPGRYKARAWIDDAWTEDVAVTVRDAAMTQPVVARQKAKQKNSRRKKQ